MKEIAMNSSKFLITNATQAELKKCLLKILYVVVMTPYGQKKFEWTVLLGDWGVSSAVLTVRYN